MDWTKLISRDNRPPGAEVIKLPGLDAVIIGRILEEERPCPTHEHDHAIVVRQPTTGLHLPGYHAPVVELTWCVQGHMVSHHLDDQATPEEIEWGWNHTTVT